MKFSKKMASIAVAGTLAIAGLTAVTLAAGPGGMPGYSAWADEGKHGKPMCHRGSGGKHGKYGRHGPKGPDYLAKKLSVMETEIGIRANQLDAWRDFTDALQATMKRPMMGPGGRGGPGMMAQGGDAEPFSLAERFADNSIERAKSAEELKQAIATLRTTLTAEQLEKVKEIEARIRSRMAMHHGWKGGHRGMGGGMGGGMGMGKGPHGGPPQATPDTPDDESGDDSDE